MTHPRASASRAAATRFARRWAIPFAIITVAFYAFALAAVIIVFPDVSNLWVSLFVLFGGLTSSLSALGALFAAPPS